MVQGCPIALYRRHRQAEFLERKKKKKISAIWGTDAMQGSITLPIAPTEEPGPLGLVKRSNGTPEVCSCDRATALEKPAFQTRCWITSKHEARGSLGLNATSVRGAAPASSTPAKVRVVCRPTRTKDQWTTLPVYTTAPPESMRARSKEALSTKPAWAEQTVGRHRQTDGPKGAGTCPVSRPSGPEPDRWKEEAWHWRGWQRGQDGDDRTPCKSPRRPSEEGIIPWEEPGRDNWPGPPQSSSSPEYTWSSGRPNGVRSKALPQQPCDTGHETLCHPDSPEVSDNRGIVTHQDDTDPTTGTETQLEPEQRLSSLARWCAENFPPGTTPPKPSDLTGGLPNPTDASVHMNRDRGRPWRGTPNTYLSSWSYQQTASTHSGDRGIWMAGSSTMGYQWSLRCHCNGRIRERPWGRKRSSEAMWPNNCYHMRTGGNERSRKSLLPESKPDEPPTGTPRETCLSASPDTGHEWMLEVRLLPVDNNSQIPTQLENQIPMLQKKSPRLRNDQPIAQIKKEVHTPPACPLRNQSKDSGEHLWGRGQTETQGTELVDTSLETKPKIQPRFRVLTDLNTAATVSIWSFINVTKPFRADRSMTGSQPHITFSTRNSQL